MKDPYKALGLTKTASEQDIKKAYRQLARTLHPDLNPGNKENEEKFKEITNAYNFLTDKDKKRKYDSGEVDGDGNPRDFYSGFSGGGHGHGGRRGFDFFNESSAFGGWGDFFDNFTKTKSAVRTEGADVTYTLSVPFIEAALGAEKEISLANGKKIKVKIPTGTEDNTTLRLKGQGTTGVGGGNSGDALITVRVLAHPQFTREGINVRITVPISLKEAVLGGKITVPTLDGKVTMTVQPGSNTGAILRLKSKGIKTQSATGDQLVRLEVALPKNDADLEKFVKSWKGANYTTRNY
jgi:DnaJ-class molecular chaperone